MALNYQDPDKVPLELGACASTGIHVSSVYLLRQWLGLVPPSIPVKVVESIPSTPYLLVHLMKFASR